MSRENFNDLYAFITVARLGSFTRAAAQIGVSQSALSHTIRALETRLGVRLLTRTTRSVSPTEAGERLLATVAPRFEEIETEIAHLSELRETPAGNIRITAGEHAANTVLWPKLEPLLLTYPDIKVEVTVEYGFIDIVAGKYDAGVRLADQVEKDMIAVRISDNLRMAVVGSPAYFARYPAPKSPQDLARHNCIRLRLATHDTLYAWEFEHNGKPVKARVDGQWTFNSSTPILRTALAGCGLAYIPENMAAPHVADGSLKHVMKSWCPDFPAYYLYYTSRRQSNSAFALVVEALRERG